MKRCFICFTAFFLFSIPCFAQPKNNTKTTENTLRIDEEKAGGAEKRKKAEYEDAIFLFNKMNPKNFIKPDMCGECHSEIYKQWKGSMHSKAFIDPIWQAATKLFNSEAKTIGQILEMKT